MLASAFLIILPIYNQFGKAGQWSVYHIFVVFKLCFQIFVSALSNHPLHGCQIWPLHFDGQSSARVRFFHIPIYCKQTFIGVYHLCIIFRIFHTFKLQVPWSSCDAEVWNTGRNDKGVFFKHIVRIWHTLNLVQYFQMNFSGGQNWERRDWGSRGGVYHCFIYLYISNKWINK